jgi:hypothetical protein
MQNAHANCYLQYLLVILYHYSCKYHIIVSNVLSMYCIEYTFILMHHSIYVHKLSLFTTTYPVYL